MMQTFKDLIRTLLSIGSNHPMEQDEVKYVRFTNVVVALTSLGFMCYIPYSIYQQDYLLATLQSLDVVLVFGVMLMSHWGHHRFARLMYLVLVNVFILVDACFIGHDGRVSDFFYLSYVMPFLLFRVRDYKHILFGVVTAVLFFHLYEQVYPFFVSYNLSHEAQLVVSQITVWMKFVLFGIAIYILAYYNFSSEGALAKINKELEERAEDLRRSNEDLEQFAYIISHDLKAPVRNIGSFMKLLLGRDLSSLDNGSKELMALSKTSAERLSNQIDDLLSYCRVDRNLPPPGKVDLNEMVRTIRMELGERIADAKAEIVVDQKLPVLKDVHSSMLHHVFQNLIANGIKFNTHPQPTVRIYYTENSDGICFSVADNGIGIDPGFEAKLFQMFQRLHTQDAFEGTGIGLAVCKKIVNFYHGNIWYESEKGHGTTFQFLLPKQYLDAEATKSFSVILRQPDLNNPRLAAINPGMAGVTTG